MRALVIGTVGWLGFALSACGHCSPSNDTPDETREAPREALSTSEPATPTTRFGPPSVEDAQLRQLGMQMNSFALGSYRVFSEDYSESNFVYSPASLTVAMAMVHAGAEGETAAEIADAFRFEEDRDVHLGAMAGVLGHWNQQTTGTRVLRVVNRLFGDEQFVVEPAYLATTRDIFGAELAKLDFRGAPDRSRQYINRWVAEQTHNKIADLMPPESVTPLSRLVLTNAVYFCSPWAHPFSPEDTQAELFHPGAGRSLSVPMMHQRGEFRAGDGALDHGGTVQLLELPYEAEGFAMLLVLPDAEHSVADVVTDLTGDDVGAQLDNWLAALSAKSVSIALPKWRAASGFRLKEKLRAFGVERAFSAEGAQLGGIAEPTADGGPLYLGEGYHRAFIDVSEAGTEAAAATAIVGTEGGGALTPLEFRADRPFVYLIRDTTTGAILFFGQVMSPTAS